MRKLFVFAVIAVFLAGMITIGIPVGASAKDIKVGAVINLTGPASS